MSNTTNSAVATLLYPSRQELDFTGIMQQIVGDLREAGFPVWEVRMIEHGLVVLEAAGRQIIAAYCDAPLSPNEYQQCIRPDGPEATLATGRVRYLLRSHQSAFILSVSSEGEAVSEPHGAEVEAADGTGGAVVMARPAVAQGPDLDALEICQTIADSVMAMARPKLVLWGPSAMVFTAREFDHADIDALSLRARAAGITLDVASAKSTPRPSAPHWELQRFIAGADFDGADIGGADVVSAPELAEPASPAQAAVLATVDNVTEIRPRQIKIGPRPRGAGQQGTGQQGTGQQGTGRPVNVANDLPQIPAAMIGEMDRVRAALHPETCEDKTLLTARQKLPLGTRLTIYGLNASLMIVALPVGAALMTYSCLGREDLKVTARITAVTGTAVGMINIFLGPGVIPFI